jgi:hypothetical protein
MPKSLFSRVTRYSQSLSMDPRENRLTEITAAVLERVDELAKEIVVELLRCACEAAVTAGAQSEGRDSSAWQDETACRRSVLAAAEAIVAPRVRVRTQVTTPKGRFVDMEVWLRPNRPGDRADDVVVWFENKDGAEIHSDQLSRTRLGRRSQR